MRNSSAVVDLPSRAARRKERTRTDLLIAATRVLSEKGLHDTKIADIAAAADVGVGTFYLHFPTKDALFDSLVEETIARLKRVVDAARATTLTAASKVRAGNLAFFRFARENREVFRIVFGHAAAYNDVVRRAQAGFAADIEESLREGIEAGEFASVDVAVAAQATVGMATQAIIWWLDHESVPVETLNDTLVHLMLQGLRPPDSTEGVSR